MLGRVVLIEGVTSEQRLEEAEKISHVAFWGKAFPSERTASAKAECLKNSRDGSVTGAERQGWEMKKEVLGAGKESLLIRGLRNSVPAKC